MNGIIWQQGNLDYPNDRITGYTLSGIQNNILNDAFALTSLREAMKNIRIVSVTNDDIDELLELY